MMDGHIFSLPGIISISSPMLAWGGERGGAI